MIINDDYARNKETNSIYILIKFEFKGTNLK